MGSVKLDSSNRGKRLYASAEDASCGDRMYWGTGALIGDYANIPAIPDCTGSTISANAGNNGCVDGRANSNILRAINDFPGPYIATQVCTGTAGTPIILHGKNDWYLPSIEELLLLYPVRTQLGLQTTGTNRYWSSSEYNISYISAKNLNVADGSTSYGSKNNRYRVRCVRAQ